MFLKYCQGYKSYVFNNVTLGLISAITFTSAQLKLHHDLQIDVQAEVSILKQALSLLQLWLQAKKTSQYLTLGLSAQVIMMLKSTVPHTTLILPLFPLLAVK